MSKHKDKIVGRAYEEPKKLVQQYSRGDIHLLFFGETGSGKELFARLYMEKSKQTGKSRTVNCAAFSSKVLTSEIFGHEKGAFTGATSKHKGLIGTCEEGILFLDELGSASQEFQSSILRVAEQNSYRPVGSDKEEHCTALLIASTSNFSNIREDLVHRFNVLYVPPLQKMDIPALAEHFLGKPLKKEFLKKLIDREYLGNVRELKRECEKMKATKRNEIFSKRSQNLSSINWVFDYERYVRENETWNKYLKPLIDKYGPHYLKYKYMEWDPNWVDPNNKDRNFLIIRPAKQLLHYPEKYDKDEYEHLKKSKVYEHHTLDLIEWLRLEADEDADLPILLKLERKSPKNYDLSFKPKRPINDDDLKNNFVRRAEQPRITSKDVVPKFRQHMREVFDECLLPLLLELIDQNYNTAAKLPTTFKKPALTPLLDLPLKKAEKEFARISAEYNLKKHSNNKTKTAERLGISMSKFNRALKSS